MSDVNIQRSSGRPINPDGTANWRVIFDDPDRGLIPAIASARSQAQLRQLLDHVALVLFKRKRDAEPRHTFLSIMSDILDREEDSEDGLERARATIMLYLTREKEDRIAKAAAYVKSKESSRSLERRGGTSAFVAIKWIAIAMGIIVLGTAAILIVSKKVDFAVLFGSQAEVEAVVEPPTQAAPPPPRAEKPVPKVAPREPNKKMMIALTPLSAVLRTNGKKARLAFVPLIGFENGDDDEAICAIAPLVADALTLRLHALSNAGDEADARRLNALASGALRDVNAQLERLKLRSLSLNDYRKLPQDVVNTAYKGCSLVNVLK